MLLTKILMLIVRFLISVVKSGLNERNLLTLPLNFFINFSPVAIWLAIFKNAGLIPKEIRPEIHVRLAHDMDLKVFSFSWFFWWLVIATGFTYLWYNLVRKYSNYYNNPLSQFIKIDEEAIKLNNYSMGGEAIDAEIDAEIDNDSLLGDDEEFGSEVSTAPSFSTPVSSGSITNTTEDSPYGSDDDISCDSRSQMIPIDTTKITRFHRLYIIPFLFFMIWPVLNIDHYLADGLKTWKDLTAWFFYVLGHITFPILTAIWLYVFHTQGALKSFSFALGVQNILGVCTHLLFPNAPPWFIKLNSLDADANYDMPGYAAGLTRVDTALGTHLHSHGFHKSPIVFGAFPSLHSAIAFQVCLFILYYARNTVLLVAGVGFVMIQWWATIYLEHHFRIDLIGGVVYAFIGFAAVYPFMLKKEKEFIRARINGDFKKGSTMGMRVFKKNKTVCRFFDPYR